MAFSFGKRTVVVPPEPVIEYTELLDRIKHGYPPRLRAHRVKSHGPVNLDEFHRHGYGRRAKNLGPRKMQRDWVA